MPEYRRLNWRHLLLLWTGVGIVLVLQTYVAIAGDGRQFDTRAHLFTISAQMYRAWMWAALTPVVFWLRRYIGMHHRHWAAVAFLHVLAGLAIFAFGNVLRVWLVSATFGYLRIDDFKLKVIYGLLGWKSLIDFFIYWVVLTAGYVTDLNWQKRQADLRAEQLRTALAQAELSALKQQVQPHFLFNSLNAVASLMRGNEPAKAIEALALLSTLLRQLMNHSGRAEIELWREFDYAQCYLSVEKVRFEEKLQTYFDADEECLGALVPTLILQPLVENAVKHGIAQRRNPGKVTVVARRVGDRLRLQVSNDPAEGGRHASESDNHGIGLRSTRARLERAFGLNQKLDCALNGPDGTIVTVELPLRFPDAA